jgi:sugar/nucleoside kinase (ribokinase family)
VASADSSVDTARFDVVGIGNALVDVLVNETDEKIEHLGMIKGAMNLVDEARSEAIYAAIGPGVEISGGSVSNSMVGIANLGGRSAYMGKVRDDQLGKIFRHDITANGVSFSTPAAADGPSTGCCLILVTPDAERTMNTYLGASVHFGPEDVDQDVIGASKILFLEGYLFDPPGAQDAFRVAARMAHDSGRTVAMTLSDQFCVERHREEFAAMVESSVDVLFANQHELVSLYQTDTLEEAMDIVQTKCAISAVTCSADGSVVVTAEDRISVPATPVAEVVDTTAAGDLYAAGFLFGLAAGHDLYTCGRLGSTAAAEVISHMGARPSVPLDELAAGVLQGG